MPRKLRCDFCSHTFKYEYSLMQHGTTEHGDLYDIINLIEQDQMNGGIVITDDIISSLR